MCARLRLARLQGGYKQRVFADRLGLSSERLKNIEIARTKLTYCVAARACELLDLNQRWLATGELPRRPFFRVANEMEILIPSQIPFSFVYDKLLHELVMEEWRTLSEIEQLPIPELESLAIVADQVGLGASRLTARRYLIENTFQRLLNLHAQNFPVDLFDEFFRDLELFLREFENRHSNTIKAFIDAGKKDPRAELEEKEIWQYVATKLELKFDGGLHPLQSPRITPYIPRDSLKIPSCSAEDRKNMLSENTSKRIFVGDEQNPPPTMSKKSVRQRLFSALESTSLTQSQFAEKFGLNRRSLENWLYREREPRGLYRERIENILSEIEGAKVGK